MKIDTSHEDEQIKRLASFVMGISFPEQESRFEENIHALLRNLLRHFGYSASSFWKLNPDLTLNDPIGINLDQTQLEEYLSWRHEYDVLYPQRFVPSIAPGVENALIECTPMNPFDPSNPYLSFLQSRNLYHADSLYLTAGGQSWTAALFKPFQKKDRNDPDALNCLKVAVPIIASQINYYQALNSRNKTTAALRVAVSLSKSGLPGKSPGRPQSAKDTYGQETAGRRE